MFDFSVEDFQNALLNWFAQHARVLPWRTQPNLYKTVVSEFMLQQTQVKTVLPYFEHWLQLFPDFETLAKAEPVCILKAWSGLGYYARAHHLHNLAKAYIQNPARSYAEWRAYKGIGDYTAAAIASIALGEAVAVVDGNVVRVLCRILGWTDQFSDKTAALKCITPFAKKLLSEKHPGAYNEAIMELGALVCTKQKAVCPFCPVQAFCQAYRKNVVDQCPNFKPIQRLVCKRQRYWIADKSGFILEPSLVGQSFKKQAQLWELPLVTPERLTHLKLEKCLFKGNRSIGNCEYHEAIYLSQQLTDLPHLLALPAFSNCQHVPFDQWEQFAFTGPHQRWIKKLVNIMSSPTNFFMS